ncbi:hypothetical protein VYH29_000609 [Vibrio fluvialis]|nr:hypothetical protein [Vibrio fluvialis]
MNKARLFIFLITIFFSATSMSTEFYKVIDTGPYYSAFSDMPDRKNYLDSHYGDLKKGLRDKLVLLNTSPYYQPNVGHVGKLVAIVPETESRAKQYVIDVLGNNFLIGSKGVEKTNVAEYNQFVEVSKKYDGAFFGFTLGKTTKSEAISILNNRKASYKDNLAYRGYHRLPVVEILDYNLVPVINGDKPDYVILRFVDDILYQIAFRWRAKSLSLADVKKFNKKNIVDTLSQGLTSKYGNPNRELLKSSSGRYISYDHFWLNPSINISLKVDNSQATAFLTYNESKLTESAKNIAKEYDQYLLQLKNQKDKNAIESAASQL